MPWPLPPAFAKNQSRSVQLEAAWEKPELLIKLYTDRAKNRVVFVVEEMAEEIITTKETLPPIHSLTSYSPSSVLICNHTPGYSGFFLPRSISAIRTLEQVWGSRKKHWWCPEDSHAWAAHCTQHGGIPGLSPPHSERVLRQTLTDSSNRLPALHVISAAQSSKLKLAYRCEPVTKKPYWDDAHVNP